MPDENRRNDTSSDILFGRLIATVEGLKDRYDRDATEGRERGRKIDDLLARQTDLGQKLHDGLRGVEQRLERQETTSLNREVQVDERLKVITLKLATLDEQAKRSADQSVQLQSEQTKIRAEVAEVKSDTAKLQVPVNQLIGLRNTVIAWGTAIGAILAFLGYVLKPLLDELIKSLSKSLGLG